jgi:hypothetical protein
MTLTLNLRTQAFSSWRFNFHFDQLRLAYKAAREASDRERGRLEAEWSSLEAEVAAGRASFTEEDEDGQVIYDRGEHMGEMFSEAEGALAIVREAFTISLHHFWERQVKDLMKVSEYNEAKAINFLKHSGITPDEPSLKALRLTANVAKHSGGGSAERLYNMRPDLFDAAEMRTYDRSPSHEYLRITDKVVDEFFEAVRRSGPPNIRPQPP